MTSLYCALIRTTIANSIVMHLKYAVVLRNVINILVVIQAFADCVHRCLVAVDTICSHPYILYGQPPSYEDYSFHNQVSVHIRNFSSTTVSYYAVQQPALDSPHSEWSCYACIRTGCRVRACNSVLVYLMNESICLVVQVIDMVLSCLPHHTGYTLATLRSFTRTLPRNATLIAR